MGEMNRLGLMAALCQAHHVSEPGEGYRWFRTLESHDEHTVADCHQYEQLAIVLS